MGIFDYPISVRLQLFSLLDSSCGDMTWMPTFLKERNDVEFTGFDIVPENIENHRNSFKDQNWKFEVCLNYFSGIKH